MLRLFWQNGDDGLVNGWSCLLSKYILLLDSHDRWRSFAGIICKLHRRNFLCFVAHHKMRRWWWRRGGGSSDPSVSRILYQSPPVIEHFSSNQNKTMKCPSAVSWSRRRRSGKEIRASSIIALSSFILTSELIINSFGHRLRYDGITATRLQRAASRSARGYFPACFAIEILIITITTGCLSNRKSGRQNYYCI